MHSTEERIALISFILSACLATELIAKVPDNIFEAANFFWRAFALGTLYFLISSTPDDNELFKPLKKINSFIWNCVSKTWLWIPTSAHKRIITVILTGVTIRILKFFFIPPAYGPSPSSIARKR